MATAVFLELYVFGPSGFWSMTPLRYAAKFDPFLSLDCAKVEGVGAQSKERKGSNFATQHSGAHMILKIRYSHLATMLAQQSLRSAVCYVTW